MTLVRVTPADVPQVQTFLEERAEYVMFPLNNLVKYGLDGDDPLSPRMWRNADGPITDVLSITKAGMVMPYLPGGAMDAASKVLNGRSIFGFVGPAADVAGLKSTLGLTGAAMELDADEAHFSLALSGLMIPDGTTHLVPASETNRAVLTEWMIDYHRSILGMSPVAAADIVPDRITREIEEDRRVILMDGDTPVAATAFNASLPQIVQIGGVYTPPALRGRGHARRAVALHLAQARDAGATRATLFANDPRAIAAYTAVGFRRIGDWALKIFRTPQVVS